MLLSVAVDVSAQTAPQTDFSLEHFEPQADPSSNLLNVSGSDVLHHLDFNMGAFFHYAHNPLLLNLSDNTGERTLELIRHQVQMDVTAAIGFFDVLNVEMVLPTTLYQQGDDLAVLGRAGDQVSGASIGDLRVTPKLRLFNRRRAYGFGLALATPVYIPIGDTTYMHSEGNLRLETRVIIDWMHDWGFAIIGNIGYQFRSRRRIHNIEVDDVVRWSVATTIPLGTPAWTVYVIGFGDISSGEVLDPSNLSGTNEIRTASPTELLTGFRYRSPYDFELSAGGGLGFLKGLGSPDARAVLGLHWRPDSGDAPTTQQALQSGSIIWHRALYISTMLLRGEGVPISRSPSPHSLFGVETAQVGQRADISTVLDIGILPPQPGDHIASGAPTLRIDPMVAFSILDVTELGVAVPFYVGSGEGDVHLGDVRVLVKGMGLNFEKEDHPATEAEAAIAPTQVASNNPEDFPQDNTPQADKASEGGDGGFGLGLAVPISIPTGAKGYTRDALEVGSRGLFDFRWKLWTFHLNQGVMVRDQLERGSSIKGLWDYGFGITWTLQTTPWQFLAEVTGLRGFEGFHRYQESARLDTSLGFHYQPDFGWRISTLVQVELQDPDHPGVWLNFGFSYAPGDQLADACVMTLGAFGADDPCPDRDGDGVYIPIDQCPQDPEDRDQFQDDDGCPEDDNDNDGFVDSEDSCPNDAEDRDQFQDDDGCPEDDNDNDLIVDAEDSCRDDAEDRDGFEDDDGCPDIDDDDDLVLDTFDQCPRVAEDRDGFEDDDGCPENDNDNDRILDDVDQCPNKPENYNGRDDDDGCPEVSLGDQRLDITEEIYFRSGRAKVLEKSFPLLDEIAEILASKPELRVRIEGHTDDRGASRRNLNLSQKRAESVRDELIKRGISADRFEAVGHGEDRPKIALDKKTARKMSKKELKAIRAQNRRVEFVVID